MIYYKTPETVNLKLLGVRGRCITFMYCNIVTKVILLTISISFEHHHIRYLLLFQSVFPIHYSYGYVSIT